MSRKDQVTKGLHEIGACWAVTASKTILPEDGFEAKPAYHIHPDRSCPHQNHIKCFRSLDEILAYIQAQKQAAADPEHGLDIMEDFWASLS